MMQIALVTLGKAGDVLSCLSIANSLGIENIVVSQQYASVIQGVPWITPHIYEGSWDDLRGAIRWAKQKFQKVFVPQTFGKEFPIAHTRPGFQIDQAARCGINSIESLKLDLPRPENAAELVSKHLLGKRNILVADRSESSPFPHREALWNLLTDRFRSTHTLVRLSEIRMGDVKDFLALYDAAEAIVTVDTAHLHLSLASKTPVLALVNDTPHRWRGSSWHPRFSFYCRYSDFMSKTELFASTLRGVVEKRSTPEIKLIPTAFQNGYNPSIIQWQGKELLAYRYHPDPALWPTLLAINDQPLSIPERLKNHSIDDPRLFIFKGKLHCSYVATPYPVPRNPAPCVVGYGEVQNVNGSWNLASHIQVKHGKNDLTGQEKNWVFFEHNQKLHCIYSCYPEHVVLELDVDRPVNLYRTQPPLCTFGQMRGGSQPLEYQGHWLRFFHTMIRDQKKFDAKDHWWFYNVGALLMEPQPPFRIVRVSNAPILSGTEQYFHGWKFWKDNVVIPYGAVPGEGGWRVSIGINDSACAEALVKPEHLNFV